MLVYFYSPYNNRLKHFLQRMMVKLKIIKEQTCLQSTFQCHEKHHNLVWQLYKPDNNILFWYISTYSQSPSAACLPHKCWDYILINLCGAIPIQWSWACVTVLTLVMSCQSFTLSSNSPALNLCGQHAPTATALLLIESLPVGYACASSWLFPVPGPLSAWADMSGYRWGVENLAAELGL